MCLSLLLLEQSALEHCAFVSVVSCSLCVFLAVFVLVCTEILSQRWRHLLGLIVWATHLTMGYTFIFSGPTVVPWDQVRSRASFFCRFPPRCLCSYLRTNPLMKCELKPGASLF